jgi:hypothetical protein
MSVNEKKKNLNIFVNCKKESILAVLENPIPSNKVEASYSQNLLDNFGLPNELEVDLHKILTNHKFLTEDLKIKDKDALD